MKKLLVLLVVLGSIFSTVGCRGTAQGIGRDVEDAGDAIKDATN